MDFFRRLGSIRLSHPTLSGIWYAFLWMMIGALILSLLLQSGSLEEHNLTWPIYIVHAAALLFGGLTSGKRAGQKGWYQGRLPEYCTAFWYCASAFWPWTIRRV